MRTRLPALLVLAILASPAFVQADTVVRKTAGAKKESGDVTVSKNSVTVKPKVGATVEVPANDVLQIDWTGVPSTLNIARNDEEGGRLAKAITDYTKILDDYKGGNEACKADLQFFIARATARQGILDPAQIDAGVKKLDDFIKKNGDHYRFYEAHQWLGQLYEAKKDSAKAQAAYGVVGDAPFPDFKMGSKIMLARLALSEGKIPAAQSEFEAVANMTAASPLEVSRVQEAKLGLAHCLQQQNNHAAAVPLLEQIIKDAAPEDARVQAEAYLRQGDSLQASGKKKEALLAYLHVDVLFPGQADLHAEALYHLSRLWTAVQQSERGAEAADRLASDYPKTTWAAKLKAAPEE